MKDLVFIPECEGFVTEESFLESLKNVGRVMLSYGKKCSVVSGLEACKRITKVEHDIVFCTEEENGDYYYIGDDMEYIMRVL